MSIKPSQPPKLRQVVLYLPSLSYQSVLLQSVFSQPLLHYLLTGLVKNEVKSLVFFLDLNANDLRAYLSIIAGRLPIQIQVINLDPKYSLWQNLADRYTKLREHFLLAPAHLLNLPYIFTQLQNWSGDVVLTATSKPIKPNSGSVKLQDRYVQEISPHQTRSHLPLLPILRLSRRFFAHAHLELIAGQSWQRCLASYLDDHLVKTCLFTRHQDFIDPLLKPLAVRRQLFPLLPPGISPQAKLSPTTLMTGPIVIEPHVQIGDFCRLQGPLYLGSGVKVSHYCSLGPNVYLQQGRDIPERTTLINTL